MNDSSLNKLIKALEKADGGSLLVTDQLIDLHNQAMSKKLNKPDYKLDKIKLGSDKFKREFCRSMLIAYKKAYENFYKGYPCCDEILARFWAGGLYGFQSTYTDDYWKEVEKILGPSLSAV